MKAISIQALLLVVAFASAPASADEVIAEQADTTAGAGLGVLTGVMLGGAAGGPVGALLGAGVGLFAGKAVQQAGGLEEQAYVVRTEQGEAVTVRSPRAEFNIGEQVERRGNRLYALEQ